MMSGIRGKNTKPEILIRKRLHALGYRYRLHSGAVPGRPDFVLPRFHAAVFVNGCFWHGHDCSLFRLPDTRRDFWKKKIERNRERDRDVSQQLADAGWRQLVIWECALRGPGRIGLDATVSDAAAWLEGSGSSAEIRGAA